MNKRMQIRQNEIRNVKFYANLFRCTPTILDKLAWKKLVSDWNWSVWMYFLKRFHTKTALKSASTEAQAFSSAWIWMRRPWIERKWQINRQKSDSQVKLRWVNLWVGRIIEQQQQKNRHSTRSTSVERKHEFRNGQACAVGWCCQYFWIWVHDMCCVFIVFLNISKQRVLAKMPLNFYTKKRLIKTETLI